MADSIKFTIGGQIGPSYKASLEMASAMAIEENERTNAVIAAQQGMQSLIPRSGAAAVAMAALRNAYNPAFMQREGFFKSVADDADKAKAHIPGLNLVLRETLVVFREIGRGNWSRVPGSISLIIQGLRGMRAELGIFGAIFTVTGAIIGGVIVAAGLFAWHIHNITKRAQELADMIDPLNKKFTEQAKALRAASKEHAEFLEWLKKIGNEEETLEEKTRRMIKALKDRTDAEIELARARGLGRQEIERMEEAQLKEELRITTLARLEASRQTQQAQFAATQAEGSYDKGISKGADAEQVNHAADNAGKILDAALDAMHASTKIIPSAIFANTLGIGPKQDTTRPANENDEMKIKVDGQTLTTTVAKAKQDFNMLSNAAAELADRQEKLKAVFEDSKSTLQQRMKAEKDLAEKQKELEDELGIKTTIGRQIAAMASGSRGSISASDWEKNGGSFGGAGASVVDVLMESLGVQRRIERNTSRGSHHESTHSRRGVDYGDGYSQGH